MKGKELGWWLYAEESIELGAAEAIDRAFRGWATARTAASLWASIRIRRRFTFIVCARSLLFTVKSRPSSSARSRSTRVTSADGFAERDAALLMLHEWQKDRSRRITVGADKAYDTKDFVRTARELNVTPHVTKNEKGRRSNLDRRTTRHAGYAISLSRRWLVEKGFRWLKQTGPLRQVKLRGLEKVDWLFVFSCAAHNLLRLPRLIAQRQPATLREQCA